MASSELGVGETVSAVLKRRVVKSGEQRRREILDAALSLFSDTGFSDTTVEDIASSAGVAKGTIYIYFDSKEHILVALKREFLDGLVSSLADVIAEAVEAVELGEVIDYRDVIDDLFQVMISYHVHRHDALEVVVRESPGPDLVQEVLELEKDVGSLLTTAFTQAMELGLIHTSDPEYSARLLVAALRDNLATCLCYQNPSDLDRLVAAAKELFYKSLAPQADLPPRRPRLVRPAR